MLQAPKIGIYAEPATATVPTQPMTSIPKQSQQPQSFCSLCMPVGRQCPNNYILPMHPEWSDLEEEKDLSKQENEEEQEKKEEEEWDGTRQKEKEQEPKINKSDSETMAPFENNTIKEDSPQLTNTLIRALPISPPEKEEQTDKQCNSYDSEFFVANSEDES